MAVDADVAGLVANAADADSCPFVLTEASHPHERDALTALRRAIETADGLVRAQFGAELRMGGEPPHLSPVGPASRFGGPPDVEDAQIAWWFGQVAEALSDAGWSGVLRPQRWEDRPQDRVHAEPWLAVTLALSGWAHANGHVVVPPWTVHPELVPQLVDLVLEWTRAIDGDLWFTRLTSVRGEESGVAEALQARLTERDSRGFASVHRQGMTGERRARFSSYGHLTLEERSSLPLEQRMAVLRSAWTGWPGRVDRSATTGDVGPGHPSWFIELARRDRKLPKSYYPHGRHLDDRRVPDACVEQVLTRAHLDAATDLSAWHVEEVALDRFLVTHPQPSRWFLPAPPGEHGTRVDPEVLAQAREDFGAMVLTDQDL